MERKCIEEEAYKTLITEDKGHVTTIENLHHIYRQLAKML